MNFDFDFSTLIEKNVVLLTDSWTVEDDLSSATIKILMYSFLQIFTILKNPKFHQKIAKFCEVQDAKRGVYILFDQAFKLVTNFSNPKSLDDDFGAGYNLLLVKWKEVFFCDFLTQKNRNDIDLSVLVQLNMIFYQIFKSYELRDISKSMIHSLSLLVDVCQAILENLSIPSQKNAYRRKVRLGFDLGLKKIATTR